MSYPEEDYFRLNLPLNEKLSFQEQMKIIRKEKLYLLQCEVEELNKY